MKPRTCVRVGVRVGVGMVWLAGCTAQAQTPVPASNSPTSSNPPPNVLAGPSVTPKKLERTLVTRDFNGKLQRLDIPAEEAAVELLTLSDMERASVKKILDERAAILDGVVANNLELLLKLQGLKEGGAGREQALSAIRQLGEKLRPLRERGRLRDEISAELAPDNADAFDVLVEEYWRAVIKDATQEAKEAQGAAVAPRQVIAKEILIALGQEIKRSYDRQIEARTDDFEALLKKLDLTPEQDGKIRNLAIESFQESMGKPTPSQRREVFAKVMQELNADQRRALLQEVYQKQNP